MQLSQITEEILVVYVYETLYSNCNNLSIFAVYLNCVCISTMKTLVLTSQRAVDRFRAVFLFWGVFQFYFP